MPDSPQQPQSSSAGSQYPPTHRPDLLRKAESIYFEIAGMDARDREDAIKRLCEGDVQLEREVRSFVQAAKKLGGFLDASALGKSIEDISRESGKFETPDELVGSTLGAFTIESRIASGGMGTVYVAGRSDGQFAQRVAIKVVKRGLDTEELLARFSEERTILSTLDHPNIARLLDAGVTKDGRPYFVMEHVDGVPIDEYCDRNRLSVRARLELFKQVCSGVQAAHQALVIHRDLKPSNILVTSQGVPKLLDFGIAKLLTPGTTARVTADTDRRLTPEYASPEQVEGGSITTASDVYSLGVVLYELLTGTRPYYFGVKTTEEVKRIVCTLVPKAPSEAVTLHVSRIGTKSQTPASAKATAAGTSPSAKTAETPISSPLSASTSTPQGIDHPKTRGVTSTRLRGQLRGDLDTIILMALRKEPQRRYTSAEALSADINRFLQGLPVNARRDTLGYRATKFLRRHAVGVTATAAAIVLLSGATIALARQSKTLATQRDELAAQSATLVQQSKTLTEQRDELRATNARSEQTRDFLVSMLSGADTGDLGPDASLGQVITQAMHDLKDHPPSEPLVRASMQQAVAKSAMSLGLVDEATELLNGAKDAFATLPAGSTTALLFRHDQAQLAFYSGDYQEAKSLLSALLKDMNASPNATPAMKADVLNDLGEVHRVLKDKADAIKAQQEALSIRKSLEKSPSLKVAESLNNLGTAFVTNEQYAEAEQNLAESLELRKQLLRADHPLVMASTNNLGNLYLRMGKGADAERLLQAAADSWSKAFGDAHPGQAIVRVSLGQSLRLQGKNEQAIKEFERALAWQKEHLEPESLQFDATNANIGISLAAMKKPEEAKTILEKVTPKLEAAGASFTRIAKQAREALDGIKK
ncbi:MAG: serine/threonine-protein kinase [Phycisphaerales bacterium]